MINLPSYYPNWYKKEYPIFEEIFSSYFNKLDFIEISVPKDILHLGLFDGRRTRPVLLLSMVEVLSLPKKHKNKIEQLSIGIEFFHRASILLDDIFDKEDTRRGETVLWKKIGIDVTILIAFFFISEGLKIISGISIEMTRQWSIHFQHIILGEYADIQGHNSIKKQEKTTYFFKYLGTILDHFTCKSIYVDAFETTGFAFQKCNDFYDNMFGDDIRNKGLKELISKKTKFSPNLEKELQILQNLSLTTKELEFFKNAFDLFTNKEYWYHEY